MSDSIKSIQTGTDAFKADGDVVINTDLDAARRLADNPDVLEIVMDGSQLDLFINDTNVGEYNTRGWHPTGDLGFYVETFDQAAVHVHYDSLVVERLD